MESIIITCKHLNKDGTYCKHEMKKDNLCARHYNKKYDYKNPPYNGETKNCTCPKHSPCVSDYPKDKVPIEKFKNPEKPGAKLYTTCFDCRQIGYKKQDERRKENEVLKNKNSEYGVCSSSCHNKEGVSKFARNKVPVTLFAYKNGKQGTCPDCSDCRNYISEQKKKRNKDRMSKAEEEGNFFCSKCNNIFSEEKMAINKDGNLSSYCLQCKEKKKLEHKTPIIARNIRIEKMYESGCSCQRCKSIFLKPLEGTTIQREFKTYEENNKRYVNYENKIYETKDFIKSFEDLLETVTIDLDHLPEEEQRARGIIGPNDPPILKKGKVYNMTYEEDMKKEAKITQNLCCKCHLIVTMEREKGGWIRTKALYKKKEYVEKIKETGCVSCGLIDKNFPRFFDLDHIDPLNKKYIISDLVRINKYTMKDLEEECAKCRVMCRACHRIHTRIQREQGLIHRFIRSSKSNSQSNDEEDWENIDIDNYSDIEEPVEKPV